ncbi:MAG: hypothetical protein Aurels2KO_45700 [Aureliella sp.]
MLILPYMDQDELYEQYDFSVPWNHPNNIRLQDSIPPLYQFPDRSGGVETNYLAIVGPSSVFDASSEDLTRAAHTLMVVENNDRHIHWMQPVDLPLDEAASGVGVPGGMTSAYLDPAGVTSDGEVLTLDSKISNDDLRQVLTVPTDQTAPPQSADGVTEIQDGRLRETKKTGSTQ